MAMEEGTPVKEPIPPYDGENNNIGTPRSTSSSGAEKPRNVGAFAVQCAKCFKLRLITTEEEYEVIRQNFSEYPWVCNRKPSVSCDDPADLEFGDTSLWLVDRPNIPKTPASCKRVMTMRRDFSKLDASYIMPNGKRVRSLRDVERFLDAYPKYKGQFSIPDFRFTVPMVMEGMCPGISKERGSSGIRKRRKNSKMED